MLLSTEAAKSAQKANLENTLETAQHALQDKQQVPCLTSRDASRPITVGGLVRRLQFLVSFCRVQELNKVQKTAEEQSKMLRERQEQCTQLEAGLKESRDKGLVSERRVEQLEGINKVGFGAGPLRTHLLLF